MSKRAEERALAYAKTHSYLGYDYDQTFDAVKYGYLQADKDLALTWIDIRNILSIAQEVEDENDDCPLLKSELCDEILRRFNEQKKK